MNVTPAQSAFASLRTELNANLIDRSDEIDVALTALVCQEHCLFVGPPGCLAGDTMIYTVRGGNGHQYRLDKLVSLFNGGPRHEVRENRGVTKSGNRFQAKIWANGKSLHIGMFATVDEAREAYKKAAMELGVRPAAWNQNTPTYVARNVNGFIQSGKLKNAWSSGVKETFEITTETGRKIRATAIHPFMTEGEEWAKLSELRVGDKVLVRGAIAKTGRKRIQYQSVYTKFHPNQRKAKSGFRYWKHRMVLEAKMNNMNFDEFVKVLRKDEKAASQLQFLTPDVAVHHIDGNHLNNDISNLQAMSHEEHGRAHNNKENVLVRTTSEKITSIQKHGEEETFDIEVEDDPHNFLANGFVVHNTAKSLLLDNILAWLQAPKFSILLNKFTTPEEVFGPLSIAGLKRDEYVRITANMLPEAVGAFTDEIFKASSAILNTMLKIMNERKFVNNGKEIAVPLRILVAASNEWPNPENGGAELGALFDRFLFRKKVEPIKTRTGLNDLLWSKRGTAGVTPNGSQTLIDQAQEQARAVTIPGDIQRTMQNILTKLNQEGIFPGDRRLRKSVGAIRAAAWLNGRIEACCDDLDILKHILWTDPGESVTKVAQIVNEIATPEKASLMKLVEEATQIMNEKRPANQNETMFATAQITKLKDTLKRCATLPKGGSYDAFRNELTETVKKCQMALIDNMN